MERQTANRLLADGLKYGKITKILSVSYFVAHGLCVNNKSTLPKNRGPKSKIDRMVKLNIERAIYTIKTAVVLDVASHLHKVTEMLDLNVNVAEVE